MADRQSFEMTQADLDQIVQACRSVPMIMLQCGTLRSPQQNANAAWAELGRRMGFDYLTVRPDDRGLRFFTAVPIAVAEPAAHEPWPKSHAVA